MNSFIGRARLLGGAALPVADDVRARIEAFGPATNPAFRGWLALDASIADQLGGVGDLVLEIAGGQRLPVTVGGHDGNGRVAVIGRGTLPAQAA